ncbi:membrane protein [alpha proteobacterium U9-1i]|nr:membrane protein [alpha proteobacterium U9-1i]
MALAVSIVAAMDGAFQFTNTWFEPSAKTWTRLIDEIRPSRVLEIGSYEGRSACFLIQACTTYAPLSLTCVDTWQGGVEHDPEAMGAVEARFDSNVRRACAEAHHDARVRKYKARSVDALTRLIAAGEAGTFDIVYIDGLHIAGDVLADAVLAFELTRVGGFIFFDDYLWHNEPAGAQDPLNMPKPAIDAFINLYQRRLGVVTDAPLRQLYVRKLA